MEVKEYITSQLAQGHIEEAKKCAYEYVAHYQADESYILLYIMFRIHDGEVAAGSWDFLEYSKDVDQLLSHYHRVKFYLRRLEMSAESENAEEEWEYFEKNHVSHYALQMITNFSIVNQKKVYGRLSELYARNGREKEAAHFVQLFVSQVDTE